MYGQANMAVPPSTSASSGHSSPESFEADDEGPNPMSSAQWQLQGQTSPSGTASSSSQQTRAAPPMQKRRRVTRACDECRRKKIKCDGKQPCTHCVVYSYDCTYDQPSNRRRNPAPQYIEALELRLHRAEALLRTFVPNIDLNDTNIDNLVQQRQANPGTDKIKSETLQPNLKSEQGHDDQDAELQSMIETTGQLDLDDNGYWDFHGGSSGAVFLSRMREQFGGLLGASKAPLLPRPPRPAAAQLESPRSSYNSPVDGGLPNTVDLPPKETARLLAVNALTCACALMKFVHGPTFWEMFDRIYDAPPESFGDEENRFLPMLYTILALGCMFTEDAEHQQELVYKTSIDQGLRYFRAARHMMDITDCRDITSLQAVIFMILFLQSTSNLSTCYSYIGVALRSGLRMGLHRNLSGNFSLIERETRRRVFWIIRKMDTYVSALLGFPRMLSDEDIDQELPLDIDDEYITKDRILPMPEGKISLQAASNAHTRLITTLAKVIKYIYPVTGVEQCTKEGSSPAYKISHAKIREVERDLQEWLDKLPMALKPGGDMDEQVVRAQQLLRMAYAHVQMMLYRPFLHYVSQRSTAGKKIDDRSYACAAACVSVSRNIVHITSEMKKRGLLVGAYWFTMYTTFFAILSLVFFVLENPDKAGSKEILADASSGRDALRGLARRSMAADRCSVALGSLFEQLPAKLKRISTEPIVSKKKRAAPHAIAVNQQDVQSSPDGQNHPQKINNSGLIQRATTFPTPLRPSIRSRQSGSFESPRYSSTGLTDQNPLHNFHELVSPTDISNAGTPDSSSTGQSFQPPLNFQQPYLENSNLPDMGAMMFPSADPFAYPNQPMIEFDNQQQKNGMVNSYMDGSSGPSNMFLSNGTAPQPNLYDNLEGQLFGPLPPYLMQNQSNIDMGNMDMNMISGMTPQDINRQRGTFTPTAGQGLNFEDIFAGTNEEWGNMMAQGYAQ